MISAHFTDEKAKALKLSNLLKITTLLSSGAEVRRNSRSLNPNTGLQPLLAVVKPWPEL